MDSAPDPTVVPWELTTVAPAAASEEAKKLLAVELVHEADRLPESVVLEAWREPLTWPGVSFEGSSMLALEVVRGVPGTGRLVSTIKDGKGGSPYS